MVYMLYLLYLGTNKIYTYSTSASHLPITMFRGIPCESELASSPPFSPAPAFSPAFSCTDSWFQRNLNETGSVSCDWVRHDDAHFESQIASLKRVYKYKQSILVLLFAWFSNTVHRMQKWKVQYAIQHPESWVWDTAPTMGSKKSLNFVPCVNQAWVCCEEVRGDGEQVPCITVHGVPSLPYNLRLSPSLHHGKAQLGRNSEGSYSHSDFLFSSLFFCFWPSGVLTTRKPHFPSPKFRITLLQIPMKHFITKIYLPYNLSGNLLWQGVVKILKFDKNTTPASYR